MTEVERLIIIPAFQERDYIRRVLAAVDVFRADCTNSVMRGYDVVVVDDGSTDSTGNIARSKGFKVLTHSERLGKTQGLRTGVEYAREKGIPYVATIDADSLNLSIDMVEWLINPVAREGMLMTIGMISDSPHNLYIYNYMFSGQRAFNTRVFDPWFDEKHPDHEHWKFMMSFKWPELGLAYLVPKGKVRLLEEIGVFEHRPALRPGKEGGVNALFAREQGECVQEIERYASQHGLNDNIPLNMLTSDSLAVFQRALKSIQGPRRNGLTP